MLPRQALYLVWAAWGISWLAAAAWSARSTAAMPLRQEMFYRMMLIAGMVLLFLPLRRLPHIQLWRLGGADWTCVALAAAGFAFCWWARIHLGRLWSSNVARKEGHRVIDSGPYGLVRHPIYTGIILASLATLLLRGTALALAGFVLTVLAWYLKARLEENFLRAELGAADYDAYAARVPMLVPFAKF
jgi:protein-S-isoprenylcysteine O-methyltransferase Ste14